MSRPRILTNFAMTADGKISTRAGTASGFTSSRDKQRLLEIRALVDAVMVGRSTAEIDNMSMTIPDEELRQRRKAAGKTENPFRVLISNSGDIPVELKVFTNHAAQTLVYTTGKIPAAAREALSKVATVHILDDKTLDLSAVVGHLRAHYQVRSLVCEGGPTLVRSLLNMDLVDEMYLTIAPVIFGGEAAPTMTGKPGSFLPASREFRLKYFQVENNECYTHYIRKRTRGRRKRTD